MQVIHYSLGKLYIALLFLGRRQPETGHECIVQGTVSVITSPSPAGFPDYAAAFIPAVLETNRPIGNFSNSPCCEFHFSVLLQSSSLFWDAVSDKPTEEGTL